MAYGQKIAQLRKNGNLTQAELGKQLNVSAQAISKWENDLAEPDLTTVKKMAEIFDVSIDDFLNHSATPKETAEDVKPPIPNTQPSSTQLPCQAQLCVTTETVSTATSTAEEQKSLPTSAPSATKAKKRAKVAQWEKTDTIKALKHSLIVGGILFVLAVAVGIWGAISATSLSSGERALVFWSIFLIGIALFTFVGCMYFSDSMQSLMVWFLTRSVRWPGIIFEFSIDGLAFLIVMKILFAVLGFLIGAAFTVAGFIIVMVLSLVIYPFSLAKAIKTIKG